MNWYSITKCSSAVNPNQDYGAWIAPDGNIFRASKPLDHQTKAYELLKFNDNKLLKKYFKEKGIKEIPALDENGKKEMIPVDELTKEQVNYFFYNTYPDPSYIIMFALGYVRAIFRFETSFTVNHELTEEQKRVMVNLIHIAKKPVRIEGTIISPSGEEEELFQSYEGAIKFLNQEIKEKSYKSPLTQFI